MTTEEFTDLTGNAPEQDDLERVNCDIVGSLGHSQCGICEQCGYPRFIPKFDGERLTCSHVARN